MAQPPMRFRPGGITTFGEKVEEHEVTIRKEAQEMEKMSELISGYLTNGPPNCFELKQIVVAHFNYFCADSTINPKFVLPAEFSFRSFSLDEGLLSAPEASGLIDPENVPTGLRSEAQESADHLKIPMIGKSQALIAGVAGRRSGPSVAGMIYSPKNAFKAIDEVIQKSAPQITTQKWVFVMRDHISIADRCLKYLKLAATNGETDNHGFRLAPLTMLALELKKLCEHISPSLPNITNEGHAERILEHLQYAYTVEIACRWHKMYEHEDVVDKCSNNIVSRMIYNLLGYIRATQLYPVFSPCFAPRQQVVDVVDHRAMEAVRKSLDQIYRYEQYVNRRGPPRRREGVEGEYE